jgi:acetylornithine/succinyldiaminopimelate/putrescine aminotransferase
MILQPSMRRSTTGRGRLEWIQGEGGVRPLPVEYVRHAKELTERHNALLVFDEIQCGVGRPGTYFAYQLADPVILPDVTVAAKPLACGLPLGAVMANDKAAASIGPGMHGTTFGGGPLACRVALEFLDILQEQLTHIHHVGGYFRMELSELARHHSFIKDVRGFGLMIGVELEMPGKQIVTDAVEEGLLINCTQENVLRFLPPYIITEPEIDRAVKVLAKIFKRVKPPAAGEPSGVTLCPRLCCPRDAGRGAQAAISASVFRASTYCRLAENGPVGDQEGVRVSRPPGSRLRAVAPAGLGDSDVVAPAHQQRIRA